jgi:hypothetical protein
MQGTRRILTQTGKDNGYAKVKMLELCDKEFKVSWGWWYALHLGG